MLFLLKAKMLFLLKAKMYYTLNCSVQLSMLFNNYMDFSATIAIHIQLNIDLVCCMC